MQILLEPKELRRIRKRWFSLGIVFAFLSLIVITILVVRAGTPIAEAQVSTPSYSILSSASKTYTFEQSITPLANNLQQTKDESAAFESWAIPVFAPLIIIYLLAMLVIIFKKLSS